MSWFRGRRPERRNDLPLEVDGYTPLEATAPWQQVGRQIRRDPPVRFAWGIFDVQRQGALAPYPGYLFYDVDSRGSHLFVSPVGAENTITKKHGLEPPIPAGPTTLERMYQDVFGGGHPLSGLGPGSIWEGAVNYDVPIAPAV